MVLANWTFTVLQHRRQARTENGTNGAYKTIKQRKTLKNMYFSST
ncbi:TPA: hypothetical protein I7264_05055 [Vibrio parahaemolyticus]|nr:hypothetical protein [Vibrio parahaemolyticus]EGR1226836.1 hypothetical protein [Vibrio parahaemolyticus]TBT91063.1 hypothetical protein D4752_14880 [Vibrio parahaemolyticus]HAS6611037.1 hypothetical protein [Vibrio parahaemolyticus]HAS6621648.1 hypothetical protein [Vibrio parahaemolyticus]